VPSWAASQIPASCRLTSSHEQRRRSTTLSDRKAWTIQEQLPRQRLESILTSVSIALVSAALRHLPPPPCPDILCLIAYTCINQCILRLTAFGKCQLPIAHTFNLQILNKVRFIDSKVYIYFSRHAWKSKLKTVLSCWISRIKRGVDG